MARGSYNIEAMRRAAANLDAATASLSELARNLTALPAGAVPAVVHHALDRLGRRGHDVLAEITQDSAATASGLSQAAECYDDLDRSLLRGFGGGG
ncbi:hypothetical protein HC028_01050 [Planosporangium flavigriseum]|uniref:Uncharacterized protein n=1 Tax=Planosporangium flavigriseum TaxID=373681 RepID=A0A8J3LV95_9ACTN|nr:hypothetical protein [Planosporangium flavigriseum]NJC63106.1 hypothetical protein [Planosporangium flavigriseum]GIG74484.1 hypothetical protein Pfl04_28880 [Planosporangium flavigriseum]